MKEIKTELAQDITTLTIYEAMLLESAGFVIAINDGQIIGIDKGCD